MKAQRRFGIALAWPRVTVVFLVGVAVLVVGAGLPDDWQPTAWWIGVGTAVAVALTGLITVRGTTLLSAFAGWIWDWSAEPEAALVAACTEPVDHHRRYARAAVGVREYRGRLVSAIAVEELDDAPHGRHSRQQPDAASLSVAAVAAGLRQFDVRLDTIDVVSVNTGSGQRFTWLTLRMDPQTNFAAIAARDSVASTLAAATERLAQDLTSQRLLARPVGSDEFAEVDSTILAGLQPTWSRPGWRRLKHFNGYATSFWISPRDITSETLERLWSADTTATVLTVRITAGHPGQLVSAWVRYHSDKPLTRAVWVGLNPLTGRQLPAVRASLPATTNRALAIPARQLRDDDETVVSLSPVHAETDPADSATPVAAAGA